jgi:hypothetical protein
VMTHDGQCSDQNALGAFAHSLDLWKSYPFFAAALVSWTGILWLPPSPVKAILCAHSLGARSSLPSD